MLLFRGTKGGCEIGAGKGCRGIGKCKEGRCSKAEWRWKWKSEGQWVLGGGDVWCFIIFYSLFEAAQLGVDIKDLTFYLHDRMLPPICGGCFRINSVPGEESILTNV